MDFLGLPELILLLVIVLLLFGVGRVAQLGHELGRAVRAFREGLQEEDDEFSSPEQKTSPPDSQKTA